MMNQYYGFTGRGGRSAGDRNTDRNRDNGWDRSPYRRPASRGGMFPYGAPQAPGTGGCGPGRPPFAGDNRQPNGGKRSDPPSQQGQSHSLPAMSRGGCGCGNRDQNDRHNCREDHLHGGCGCGGNSSCKLLMDQIRAVDFALYETVLYLDVYPNSCDALETYHKLKAQHEALRREYEATCGPLTAFGNQSTASWDWMGKPFPWEYDAD